MSNMKKGKGMLLAILATILLLMTFLLSPMLATTDIDLLTLAPDPVGPGPPVVVLAVTALGAGVVLISVFIDPPAPPYSIGSFNGSLDLNNHNITDLKIAGTTLGNLMSITNTKKAVIAVTSGNYYL